MDGVEIYCHKKRLSRALRAQLLKYFSRNTELQTDELFSEIESNLSPGLKTQVCMHAHCMLYACI